MYCSNCGAKIEAGAKFCTECGTKVEINNAPSMGDVVMKDGVRNQAFPNMGMMVGGGNTGSMMGLLVTVMLLNGMQKNLYYNNGHYFIDPNCQNEYPKNEIKNADDKPSNVQGSAIFIVGGGH